MGKTSAAPATSAEQMLNDATAEAPPEATFEPVPETPPSDFPDSPAAGVSAEALKEMTDADRANLLAAHQAHIAPQVQAAMASMQTKVYADGSSRHGCPPFPAESPLEQQVRQNREAQEAADPSLVGLAERQQALGTENVITANQVNQRAG